MYDGYKGDSRIKGILKYDDYDKKCVFGILASNNVKILKSSYQTVVIEIRNYEDLNKILAKLNNVTSHGVSVKKVRKPFFY